MYQYPLLYQQRWQRLWHGRGEATIARARTLSFKVATPELAPFRELVKLSFGQTLHATRRTSEISRAIFVQPLICAMGGWRWAGKSEAVISGLVSRFGQWGPGSQVDPSQTFPQHLRSTASAPRPAGARDTRRASNARVRAHARLLRADGAPRSSRMTGASHRNATEPRTRAATGGALTLSTAQRLALSGGRD